MCVCWILTLTISQAQTAHLKQTARGILFLPLNPEPQVMLPFYPRIVSASAVLEPMVFDGNPANYCSFVDSFDALICPVVLDHKQRLF